MRKLVVVVGSTVTLISCSDDSPNACALMREELESLTPSPGTVVAWNDIVDLQQVVTRALALRSEIDTRCAKIAPKGGSVGSSRTSTISKATLASP
jgi:hypothetical protein